MTEEQAWAYPGAEKDGEPEMRRIDDAAPAHGTPSLYGQPLES